MVRLEKIRISGAELELNPPVIIGDDETMSITGDGKLLWSAPGFIMERTWIDVGKIRPRREVSFL